MTPVSAKTSNRKAVRYNTCSTVWLVKNQSVGGRIPSLLSNGSNFVSKNKAANSLHLSVENCLGEVRGEGSVVDFSRGHL